MDELAKAYEILGVPSEISTPDLQKFYRELVKRWHPDQFSHDAEERQVADETLRSINAAYQRIMKARKEAANNPETETAEEPPSSDGGNFSEEEEPPKPSGNKAAILSFALLLVMLAAAIAWWPKKPAMATTSPSATSSATELSSKATPAEPPIPPPPAAPPPVIAHRICLMADNFVTEVWHNGKLVPDSQRHMVADRYGAVTEEVNLTLREGDWLVFNPVNYSLRWGGAVFFGAAGMTTNKTVAFESSTMDGRWTYLENMSQISQFISQRDMAGRPVNKINPSKMWSEGPHFMNEVMGTDWHGEPIWGQSRSTYIKFVARPIQTTAKKP